MVGFGDHLLTAFLGVNEGRFRKHLLVTVIAC